MLALPEAWVWDFWLADDGEQYHLFFLCASRALTEPPRRHYQAAVGHAVSRDLVAWERVVDALIRSDPPAFADLATWTGSITRHPDGTWFMFYTGATLTPAGNVQTIGYATSCDLMTWDKAPDNPVLRADDRWYEKLADRKWPDEAFRDPWVVPDPDGNGWHLLITARANHGPIDDRGVVGHAWSPDLRTWRLEAPLSQPGQGFGQLEVCELAVVDGQPLLLFSCLHRDLSAGRRSTGTSGGVWVARADAALGPYQLAEAQQLTDSRFYVGRLIRRQGTSETMFLAFRHDAADGSFVGEICDPQPAHWNGRELIILGPPVLLESAPRTAHSGLGR